MKKKKVISSCYPKATYGATTTSRLRETNLYHLIVCLKGHLQEINVTRSCTQKATYEGEKCDLVMYPKGHGLQEKNVTWSCYPKGRLRDYEGKKCDLVMYPKGHLREKKIVFLIYCSTPLWFCSLTQFIDLIYKLTPLFKVQSFIAKF